MKYIKIISFFLNLILLLFGIFSFNFYFYFKLNFNNINININIILISILLIINGILNIKINKKKQYYKNITSLLIIQLIISVLIKSKKNITIENKGIYNITDYPLLNIYKNLNINEKKYINKELKCEENKCNKIIKKLNIKLEEVINRIYLSLNIILCIEIIISNYNINDIN